MRLSSALFTFFLFVVATASAQNARPVYFPGGTVLLPENFKSAETRIAPEPGEIVNGYVVRVIQCATIPTARQREALEQEGVQFIGYFPNRAYLVAFPESLDPAQFERLQVRSMTRMEPQWKIARNLREEPLGPWAVQGDLVDVNLQVYPHVRIGEAAEWCRQAGISILKEGNQNGFLQARVAKSQLMAAASLPFVRFLELVPAPGTPEDNRGRALHRSNLLDPENGIGPKYNGQGVRVLVRDDGPVGPHADYKGRLVNIDEKSAPFGDVDHADQVASCVGSAGNIDPTARGMAAGAEIFTINYVADFQDQTLLLHLTENITITNTSYSNMCNAGYTLAAQTVDQQLAVNPTLMHVFSSGNSNGSNCNYGAGSQWGNITGGHKMAKNAIAVANLFADGTLNNTSSRGPAHDGRLKPDIAAHGSAVNMTEPNNAYSTSSGTSFSSPAVAGCLAQLSQAYQDQHSGAQPDAALLKTAILNTANDLGNGGPDYKFGWGHINNYRALRLLQNNQWLTGSADQGAANTHTLQVPAGTRQLRVMLYWVDPPAAADINKALVNDLDLTLTAPSGLLSLPWKLDPTPDPAKLDAPAGKGRDSLNNVEQVVVDNPGAGAWTINVKGFEVPLGPQNYILAWEFLTDAIKITYPVGGEGLYPGDKVLVHWDAYGTDKHFALEYSADNGASWSPVYAVPGDKRLYEWTVPTTINGQSKLRLIRGDQADTTAVPFTIAPFPTNLAVNRVCPDSMTASWSGINDTLRYDVYLLGSRYMEIVGNTDTTTYTFPIQNAGAQQWFSVRASYPNGLAGRRALAASWAGGLKSCTQPDDVSLRNILSPNALSSVSCSAVVLPVTIRIVNDGLNTISGALANYQLDDAPVVTEPLPDVLPGDTLDYSFNQKLTLTENKHYRFRSWSTYAQEDARFNDTLALNFTAVVAPFNNFFQEGFQGTEFPPLGWAIGNPDDEVTWSLTKSNVTGPDGKPTRAVIQACFDYDKNGAEDALQLPPLDLGNLQDPALRFDLSHATYDNNNTYNDKLRVEVYPNCEQNATPTILWTKEGSELATTNPSTISFVPNNAQDWRVETVSLKDFAGQTVLVRLVSTNDYGNNIYLDNVGLISYTPVAPVAAFTTSVDTLCRLDTIILAAIPANGPANYRWTFGSGAQPTTSATGPGPHRVRYILAGNKNVQLIVSNALGADTLTRVVTVQNPPQANYTYAADKATVTFTNTSTNATQFTWDFGDGATSAEKDPVHVYAKPGDYTVKLQATNTCNTAEKTQSIPVTFVGTQEPQELQAGRVAPNPTDGDFRVEWVAKAPVAVRLILMDAGGRVLESRELACQPGAVAVPFQGLRLPKGVYKVQLQTQTGVLVFSLAVQ